MWAIKIVKFEEVCCRILTGLKKCSHPNLGSSSARYLVDNLFEKYDSGALVVF